MDAPNSGLTSDVMLSSAFVVGSTQRGVTVALFVLAGVQYRAGAIRARDSQLPVVGLMPVNRHDRVEVGIHRLHDCAECGGITGGTEQWILRCRDHATLEVGLPRVQFVGADRTRGNPHRLQRIDGYRYR